MLYTNRFKSLILAFVTFSTILYILLYFSVVKKYPSKQITGHWYSEIENIRIFFSDDREFSFTQSIQDSIITNLDGEYIIDLSKTPIPLTILNVSQLNHKLYGIVGLVNDSTLIISKFSKRWRHRPISFNDSKYFYFKKEKNKTHDK